VILTLKLTGEKEIFYLQERIGKNLISFKLYKFATMVKDSENIGSGSITIKNDPRVLPVGKILRKSKINELPQLINILKGEMSFVGPRPLVSRVFNFYNENEQKIISQVRPGLTGISSLKFRDEESLFKAVIDTEDFYKAKITPVKAKLEDWFVSNYTIKLYFQIILFTALSVIFPKKDFLVYISKDLVSIYDELLGKY
tara:strand:+ start:19398 stop:19994 length:597 start_codon:yes stop_codon:yes gene_type:complete